MALVKELQRLLPDQVQMIIGGHGTREIATDLASIGGLHQQSLSEFREDLDQVRASRLAG